MRVFLVAEVEGAESAEEFGSVIVLIMVNQDSIDIWLGGFFSLALPARHSIVFWPGV